jgi:hypothetical protein
MKISGHRKQCHILLVVSALSVLFMSRMILAQDLAPRAYLITPHHANAVTLTWALEWRTTTVPGVEDSLTKFNYSDGTYIRYGGNYQSFSIGWQYSWIGNPKLRPARQAPLASTQSMIWNCTVHSASIHNTEAAHTFTSSFERCMESNEVASCVLLPRSYLRGTVTDRAHRSGADGDPYRTASTRRVGVVGVASGPGYVWVSGYLRWNGNG